MKKANITFIKTVLPHFYELKWSTDSSKTVEKVYLGIRGKLGGKPCLYLTVRTDSTIWHSNKYREISMAEFLMKANYKNVATFYKGLQNNKLLYYPKKIRNDLFKHYGINDLFLSKERNRER